jgi:hypothetical protein
VLKSRFYFFLLITTVYLRKIRNQTNDRSKICLYVTLCYLINSLKFHKSGKKLFPGETRQSVPLNVKYWLKDFALTAHFFYKVVDFQRAHTFFHEKLHADFNVGQPVSFVLKTAGTKDSWYLVSRVKLCNCIFR